MIRSKASPRTLGSPRGGFTLAEILVVILVMSGLLLSITMVLESARRTRDLIHNIQENQLAGPAILDHMERDIRAVFVYGRPPEDAFRVLDRTVAGRDGDRLDFITATNSLVLTEDLSADVFLRADFNEVGYVLRENPRNEDFLEIYRRESFGVDEEPFEGGRYTFLHDRVKGLNIEIFEEDDTADEEAEPLDEWDGVEQVGLPARVEITLTLELAPRLVREQLEMASVDKRTVEYRRVIRFPQYLRDSVALQPLPLVPAFEPQEGQGGVGGGGGGGAAGEDGLTDPSAGAGFGEVLGGGSATGGDSGGFGGAAPVNPFGGG